METLEGRLFIAAGAGSGKTAVVASRFVHAIATGAARVDEILTITFTKKAAAEMMCRIRDVLKYSMSIEKDPERLARVTDCYRNIEQARISTIDGFYSSVLKANALAAGIDPGFTVADENQEDILSRECFDSCLYGFVVKHGEAATDLITAYDPGLNGGLYEDIRNLYNELRCRGQEITLPLPDVEKTVSAAADELSAAMDDYEAAVRREGCDKKNALANLESVSHLRQAIKEADPQASYELAAGCKIDNRTGKVKAECAVMKDAWKRYKNALRAPAALKDLRLLGILLEEFHSTYSAEKYIRGILDFSDLSLFTRDLLRDNRGIRERMAAGFKLLMVDEFQDTNRLQRDIIEMLSGENLLMVGDENQSIYGFRDAEVELFQQEDRRAREGEYRIDLAVNFRSQPEILAFVDHLFSGADMLGAGYLKLEPGAETDPRSEDHRVEVLMVDRRPPGREKVLSADESRTVEAQLIAERLKELFDEGHYEPGDAAILVRNRTGVESYRDALDRMGIENYLAIGVGFYERQELSDVINMFSLLVNPLDDTALSAALRSPLAGVTDDALYWLRQAAGAGESDPAPLWPAVRSAEKLNRFSESDREKLAGFSSGLERLRKSSRRASLADTARQVIAFNDYAATRAACAGGKQKLANLMKLVDLASDYEAAWGRDLESFVEFMAEKKSEKPKEGEPPVEQEGVQAVRILTMHSAKGLEFPLVVLPKLADERKGHGKPLLLIDREESSSPRVGLSYCSDGEKGEPLIDYDDLMAEKKDRDLKEEKRLHYVAMTRAKRHLVLVGSTILEKKPDTSEKAKAFDWIRTLLELDRESRPGLDQIVAIDSLEGAGVGISVCTDADAVLERAAAEAAARHARPAPVVSGRITEIPEAAVYAPTVISPTALDTFNACARRYYLENVLRSGDLLGIQGTGVAAADGCNLSRTAMGTLVHGILETDLPQPGAEPPSDDFLKEKVHQLLPQLKPAAADFERARHLITNLAGAPVARSLQDAAGTTRLKREHSFSTMAGQTIIQGKIDVLIMPGEKDVQTVVVDYKTSSPGKGRTPEEEAAKYRYQMGAYALAALRLHGSPVKVVLVFLGGAEPVEVISEYSPSDIPVLEDDINSILARMGEGAFPVLSEFDAHQCPWCAGGPGNAALCH